MSEESKQPTVRDFDNEIVREGTHSGLRYRVLKHDLGHFCGYVRSVFADEWETDDFETYPHALASVHGGVTYGPDAGGWVGFDTAHVGDISRDEGDGWGDAAEMYAPDDDRATVWTPEDVVGECCDLAEQMTVLGEFAEKAAGRLGSEDSDE